MFEFSPDIPIDEELDDFASDSSDDNPDPYQQQAASRIRSYYAPIPVENFSIKYDKRINRTQEEIEAELHKTMEEFIDILDLKDLKFETPTNCSGYRKMVSTLQVISKLVTDDYEFLISSNNGPLQENLHIIKNIRDYLLDILISYDAGASALVTISDSIELVQFRLDELTFEVFLQCTAYIYEAPRVKANVGKLYPGAFRGLKDMMVFPRDIVNKPFISFTFADITKCLGRLEALWFEILYSDELLNYIEVLVTIASALYIIPQSKEQFAISEYYSVKKDMDGEEVCIASSKLLQDLCWSVIPMYRRILVHMKIHKTFQVERVNVNKDHTDKLKRFFVQNCKDMNGKNITETFMKLHIPLTIRPSEKNRFSRDYKKTLTASDVMRKMRNKADVSTMMSKFDFAPWTIINEKKFDKATSDVLMVLLIDSFTSNTLGIKWMDLYVDFNIVILKDGTNYVWNVDKEYPRLVQDFNFFNLFYRNTVYVHNNAVSAFSQWMEILMRPPFNGKIGTKDIRGMKMKIDEHLNKMV